MTFAACDPPAAPTCDQKQAQELLDATRSYDLFCDGEANLNDLLRLFVLPPWTTDSDDQKKALVNYLTRHAICSPTNHAAVECVSCEDPIPTGCPDPDECPSKFYGYGLLEVIMAAIRADSMAYVPIANLADIAPGEAMVWHPTQVPDNPQCDPCLPNAVGAFVPAHKYDEAFPGG